MHLANVIEILKMEMKNMNWEEIERVEVYYERIQKLVHGLQIPNRNNFLTIVLRTGLQSYFKIAVIGMN